MKGFLARECATRRVSAAIRLAQVARSLLRYLYLAGLIPVALDWAVPSVAPARGRALPRGVSATKVGALLSSCDRGAAGRPGRLRDLVVAGQAGITCCGERLAVGQVAAVGELAQRVRERFLIGKIGERERPGQHRCELRRMIMQPSPPQSYSRLDFVGHPRVPVNPRVAWALNGSGDLFRTTNAGASWQLVWSATGPRESPLSSPITKLTASALPILSVQSASSASIVTLANRSTTGRAPELTNLVVYRTTNGGHSWQTYPVGL